MEIVQTELTKGTEISSAEIRDVLDLAMNAVMALSDDRHALDRDSSKLGRLAQIEVKAIYETINTILGQRLQAKSPFFQQGLNWDYYKFNPDTNGLDAYIHLFIDAGEPNAQSLILQKLYGTGPLFATKEVGALSRLTLQYFSLEILAKTCDIQSSSESHLELNILGKPSVFTVGGSRS